MKHLKLILFCILAIPLIAGYYIILTDAEAHPPPAFVINKSGDVLPQSSPDPSCPPPNCPQPNVSLSCNPAACNCNPTLEIPDKPLFVIEAESVAASHDYDPDGFHCENYADELVRRLRLDGYTASKCIGICLDCSCKYPDEQGRCWHAWVKMGGLAIESVTGEFIPPVDYEESYVEQYCT